MQGQEIISDLILCEKKMSSNYDSFASECVNERLRDTFLDLLAKGHKNQTDLFKMAQKNGWSQTQNAEKQKIDQAYQKYSHQMPQMAE